MDEKLTGFITTEYKIGKLSIAPIDLLLLVFTIVFGIMLRSKVWMIGGVIESGIEILGSFAQVMKGISIFFDVVMAILAGYYVFLLSGSKVRGYIAYAILFLLPPVVMTSAMWGSGDSVYLSAVLLSLIALRKEKSKTALTIYILACFFHPYALFLLPLFLAYGAKYGFGMPAGLSVALPGLGLVAGAANLLLRSGDSIYLFTKAEYFISAQRMERLLSYHFPNLYQMIGEGAFVSEYEKIGAAMGVALGICLFLYCCRQLETAGKESMVLSGILCALALSFILPGMDERAGLLAMLLSVCLAMQKPKTAWLAIFEAILCFLAGAAFFRGESFWPLSIPALLQLLVMVACFDGRLLGMRIERTTEKNDKE